MDKKMEGKLLSTWAKKTGKTVKELREILKEAQEEAKGLGQEANDQIVKGRFAKKIRGRMFFESRGMSRNEPVRFEGFLIGADALRDIQDIRRRKSLKEYREDPDGAKLAGFVDEQGNPLDYRETIKDRKGQDVENPNYHKPLIGHQYVRDIYGIVKKNGDTVPKLFKMTLWRGYAEKFTYRPFTPITFRGLQKADKPFYRLNMSRADDAKMRITEQEIDYEEWMRSALGDRTCELEKLDKAVRDCANAIDPWVMLEGMVDFIDPEINQKTGSRSVTITDVDSGFMDVIRIFIPKDFPIAFREYSRVLVFGKPRRWKRADEDEYRYSMNGISIFPIPGKTVETKFERGKANGKTQEDEGYNIWEE